MNTLANIGGIVAALWMAIFFFNTVNQAALGFVGLVLFVMEIPMTIWAVTEDWQIWFG